MKTSIGFDQAIIEEELFVTLSKILGFVLVMYIIDFYG